DEEWEDNVRCVGAPIYDYRGTTIAAVSTVWHMNQAKNQSVEETAAYVRE
ncbi:MAG: IclR family transcriptional regulator, partial [Aliifodinibius sp.]|nr:IclR family transcriptional regulator [Fodinibius sp.]NIV14938.1 IclR family transcriptional regulator [Fodinibius sp.]NIY28797.1 IclR family transcriptional regulator [Fodinibius sp.]